MRPSMEGVLLKFIKASRTEAIFNFKLILHQTHVLPKGAVNGRFWPLGLATAGGLDGRLLGSTRRRGDAAERR
jgi:hypothetical protein